jgi:hypothetical protein
VTAGTGHTAHGHDHDHEGSTVTVVVISKPETKSPETPPAPVPAPTGGGGGSPHDAPPPPPPSGPRGPVIGHIPPPVQQPARPLPPQRGFLVLGGADGTGGDAWSATVEVQGPLQGADFTLGLGGSYIATSTRHEPSGVLDYPAPTTLTHDAGQYANKSYAVYAIIAAPAFNSIFVRGLLGVGRETCDTLVQSDTTGWYYRNRSHTNTRLLIGGGLALMPGVVASYDNIRGLMLGWAF